MANPPWEPYPEKKRKLDERAQRSRNKHRQLGGRGGEKDNCNVGKRSSRNPATDSSLSSSASSVSSASTYASADLPPRPDRGKRHHRRHSKGRKSTTTGNNHHHSMSSASSHFHARVRPENCECLAEGGCGDEDGCCVEDLPGAAECPCHGKNTTAVILWVGDDSCTGRNILLHETLQS